MTVSTASPSATVDLCLLLWCEDSLHLGLRLHVNGPDLAVLLVFVHRRFAFYALDLLCFILKDGTDFLLLVRSELEALGHRPEFSFSDICGRPGVMRCRRR